MPRLDYRLTEEELPLRDFVRALITLIVQQLNQLRTYHGLPQLTRPQVIQAIKNEMRNL